MNTKYVNCTATLARFALLFDFFYSWNCVSQNSKLALRHFTQSALFIALILLFRSVLAGPTSGHGKRGGQERDGIDRFTEVRTRYSL